MPPVALKGSNYFGIEVANAMVPKEGPKGAPIPLQFTTSETSFVLKQLLTQSLQFMTMVQGAYVDNSQNPQALYITASVINHTIKIKAGYSGFIPLLAPRNCDLTFTSSGAASVVVTLLNTPVPAFMADTNETAQGYVPVAASTTQVMGLTGGAVGDFIEGMLIIPATTSPGAVTITDGAGAPITIFTGGVGSVGSLVPFYVPLSIQSTDGAWTVTTGSNVSVLVTGQFT